MLKDKHGFTLIELLAVISILSIIVAVVTPNMMQTINNNKNEQYTSFAKELLTQGKYYYTLKEKYGDVFTKDDNCYLASASKLGFSNVEDPDKGKYNMNDSEIKICIESNELKYYVRTYGSIKGVLDYNKPDNFVNEDDLSSDMVVRIE